MMASGKRRATGRT